MRTQLSLRVAVVAALFSAGATLVYSNGLDNLPIFSLMIGSIAEIFIVISFLIVVITVALLYRRMLILEERGTWAFLLIGRVTSSVVLALLVTFAVSLLALVLYEVFPEAKVNRYMIVLLATVYGAVLGFVIAYIAVYLTTAQMLAISGLMLLTGLVLASSLAVDRDWWTNSLSFLGWDDGSNVFFDVAIILGGLLILAAVGDVILELRHLRDEGRIPSCGFAIVRVIVLVVGVGIICVGLFPMRVSTLSSTIHQAGALVAFGGLFVLMGAMRQWLPVYPAWFYRAGYLLLGVCVGAIVLHFFFDAVSYVVLEMILVVAVAPWTFMFAQKTDQIVTGQRLTVVLSDLMQRRVRYSLRTGLLAGGLAGLAALLTLLRTGEVPILAADTHSLGAMLVFLVYPTALFVPAFSYRRFSEQSHKTRTRLLVSIAISFLVGQITIALVYILENAFTGVSIPAFSASLIIAAACTLLGIYLAFITSDFDEMEVLVLIAVVFGVGIILATTHAADPLWWQHSISFLGHDGGAFLFFSVTMVLTGLLLVVVGSDVITRLQIWAVQYPDKADGARLGLLRLGLNILGLGVVGVGLFPTTITRITNDLHNISSHGMLLAFLLLLLGFQRLVPVFPRAFFQVGYVLAGTAILNIVLYFQGIFNYVVMEFLLVGIMGAWLTLLVHNTYRLTGYTGRADETLRASQSA